MDPRPDSPSESADDQDKAPAVGSTSPSESDPDGDTEHGESPAERIIALFGGIRPMASKLHVPVTTVQGWKKRGAIPEARHDDIRNAAAAHGIALSSDDLAAATPEVTEAEAATEEPVAATGAAVETTRIAPEEVGAVGEAEKRALGVSGRSEPAAEPEEAAAADAAERLEGKLEEGERAAPALAAAGPSDPTAAAESRPSPGGVSPTGGGPAGGGPDDEGHEDGPPDVAHGASGVAWLALVLAIVGTAGAFTAPLWGPSVAPGIWPPATADEARQAAAALEEQVALLDERASELAEGQQALRDQVEGMQLEPPAAADLEALQGTVNDLQTGLAAVERQVATLADRVEEIAAEPAGPGLEAAADIGGLEERLSAIESRLVELQGGEGIPADVQAQLDELAEGLAALEDRLVEESGAEDAGAGEGPQVTTGLGDRIAALEEALAEAEDAAAPVDATALAALSGQLDAINGRLAGLETRMNEVVADRIAAIRDRLGALDDLQASLEAVERRLADLEDAPLADPAMADIIQQLQSRATGLSGSLSAVRQRIDEVAQRAAERRAADLRGQALSLATAQLRQQVNAGAAFVVPLQAVLSLIDADSPVYQALEPLEAHAGEGIPTREALAARFEEVAARAREAAALPPDADWFEEAVSAVTGLVSVTPVPGEAAGSDSVEGRLARAAYRVSNGNLETAVEALRGLEGPAAEAVSGWLAEAEARLAAEAALRALEERAIRRLMEVEAAAAAAGAGTGEGADRVGQPGGGTTAGTEAEAGADEAGETGETGDDAGETPDAGAGPAPEAPSPPAGAEPDGDAGSGEADQ